MRFWIKKNLMGIMLDWFANKRAIAPHIRVWEKDRRQRNQPNIRLCRDQKKEKGTRDALRSPQTRSESYRFRLLGCIDAKYEFLFAAIPQILRKFAKRIVIPRQKYRAFS